ncbi:hypothetical protein SAMN05216371_8007 [Streptomyces sp. TLI_053]|uniref:hypothetical protein n=1 Tax=Streptomyces sp. TLI_053 TaxID=1855352 RepID=UPI00087DBF9C|nr:hypothetical protein [Streptomyces sp. TLI_053]SDT83193.1 hypothetical protein SAMN05216371_8007 [Streptomyces sp. TLI_053]
MGRPELVDVIREVAGFGVWRGSGNIDEEALENIEYFSAPPGEQGDDDREALAAALTGTMEAWLRDAATDGTGRPGVVYLWHDDQAAQLRLSFVSAGRDGIPFGVPLVFVDGPQEILNDFLIGAHRASGAPLKVFARELAAAA